FESNAAPPLGSAPRESALEGRYAASLRGDVSMLLWGGESPPEAAAAGGAADRSVQGEDLLQLARLFEHAAAESFRLAAGGGDGLVEAHCGCGVGVRFGSSVAQRVAGEEVVLVEAAVGAVERVGDDLTRLHRRFLGEVAQRLAGVVVALLRVGVVDLEREGDAPAFGCALVRVADEAFGQGRGERLGQGLVDVEELAVEGVDLRFDAVVGVFLR